MTAVSLLQLGSAAVLNASFAWMVGVLLARFWLRGADAGWSAGLASALYRSQLAAVGLCLLASCAALWAAAAVMAGVPLAEAAGTLWMMLSKTDFGRAGLLGLVALCLAAALGPLAVRRQGVDLAIAALLLAFAFCRASISHAGEDGLLSLGLAIEWAHLLLIAAWVGGVALAGLVVLPRVRQDPRHGAGVGAYLARLSDMATAAVAGILASGIYNAWHRVGSVENLFGNSYGSALLVKIAVVSLALSLGGYNKLVGFPSFGRSAQAASRVIAVLRVETVLLAAALIAAAMLSSQQPPASI